MSEERPNTRWRPLAEPCLNCGDPTPGRYCPTCGQRKVEVLVSIRGLLADVLEDQLVLNRALPRTLGALLFRPGFLTAEYVRGRIVRYIAPFRLYLVSSVVFFLLLSFLGLSGLRVNVFATDDIGAAVDSANVALDSISRSLRARQQVLAELDTTDMPAPVRAALRQQMAGVAAALDTSDASGIRPIPPVDIQMPRLPPGMMQPWAREIETDQVPAPFDAAIERKLAQVGHLPPQEAIRTLLGDLLEYAPHMVFLLLPLFALILKLLYIRRGRYYAEHFVFALHVHAFVFAVFTIVFILPWDAITAASVLWIMLYVWLALRHVYRQGWVRTTVKWFVLGGTYFFFFLLGLVGLGVATLLLT